VAGNRARAHFYGEVASDLRFFRIVSIFFEAMPAPTKLNASNIAVVARTKAAC
jgi:hypothetical protein